MEYDEGREITRLIAEEMISVASGFPNISPEMVKILAALHLTKGLILEDRYRYIFNEACSEVAERCLKEYDDADIRAALNAKLEQLRDDHALPLDRDIRVKTATYLIDRYIMDNYNISYDHPAAVGALVGSIHLSLRSPLIEFTPITGELSMAMHKTQTSVTMLYPRSTTLRALITLKLIINKIFANFIHGQIPDVITGGIFQGSCRVNRLTMPPFSRSVALDPGSTTRCRSVPSYASGLTTAPVCFPWLVRTTHVAGPRPDGPALDAAQPV